ncbi:MAG TPA: hypothetical protein VNQ90_10460 [Chthoniobacteraceae bacterium]|nr:hypothetical protein [Chthoniobacteraceae bacterium]
MPLSRRTSLNALTLVELLIVLSLAAVLVALLTSVIHSGRSRVQMAQCQANLRQIGIALHACINDTGRVPVYRDEEGPWYRALDPYLGWGTWPRNFPLSRCPAERENEPFSTYGLNSEYNGTRITEIAQPSRAFAVGDSDHTAGSYIRIPPTIEKQISFRHQHRANLLFLDGHVEARRPEQIPRDTSTATKKQEYLLFWKPMVRQ